MCQVWCDYAFAIERLVNYNMAENAWSHDGLLVDCWSCAHTARIFGHTYMYIYTGFFKIVVVFFDSQLSYEL